METVEALLDKIKLGILANGDEKERESCTCPVEAPCERCAIFDALKVSREFIIDYFAGEIKRKIASEPYKFRLDSEKDVLVISTSHEGIFSEYRRTLMDAAYKLLGLPIILIPPGVSLDAIRKKEIAPWVAYKEFTDASR